jgi:hypothetical protein
MKPKSKIAEWLQELLIARQRPIFFSDMEMRRRRNIRFLSESAEGNRVRWAVLIGSSNLEKLATVWKLTEAMRELEQFRGRIREYHEVHRRLNESKAFVPYRCYCEDRPKSVQKGSGLKNLRYRNRVPG